MTENSQEQPVPPPAPRGPGRPFPRGESGNPLGRPVGSLDRRTVALRDALVESGEEAAGVLVDLMRQTKLRRTQLRAAESILDRIGAGRVSRQETVQLDARSLDEAELLRVATAGELGRLDAMGDEIAQIFEELRRRRDAGAEPDEPGRSRDDGLEVFNVGGEP